MRPNSMSLPYYCRSRTCTTYIEKYLEDEIDQDMAFAIGDEELEQGLRLNCIGRRLRTWCWTLDQESAIQKV
jgi:ferredoxin